jgi:poly(A)-specific ribonuclease
MLTDTMQILRQFFSPLPESFEDFRSMTNALFPNILDTKYMASLTPLKELINNTTLGDMDKILDKEPFPKLTLENCAYSTNDEKLHEAGYDAFLTGYCYLRMLNYLVSFNSSRQNLVEYYSNKIFLMKCFDITFIDLKNKQDDPKRDNVFYVEFPPTWETQNLHDLFSSFGTVFIGWIDDSSAFVALQNQENIKKAAGQLIGLSGRDYRVYFYSTYQKNKLNKNDSKKFNQNKNLPANEPSNNSINTSNGNIEKRKNAEDSTFIKTIEVSNHFNNLNDEVPVEMNRSQSEEANQSLKKIKLK